MRQTPRLPIRQIASRQPLLHRLPRSLVAVLAAGCFTPANDPFVVDILSYATEYTTSPDIVLQPFRYAALACPDGEPATFYALYREGLTAAAPVVIVFHSQAFDYVVAPKQEDPLAGAHYSEEDRLSSTWAAGRVFETLGLLVDDSGESDEGTVAAALAEAGALAIYPANCWGDLWHNESGFKPNSDAEYFERNGRALAWAVTGMFSADPATATHWREVLDFSVPITFEEGTVAMIGLGEGGRAPVELLRRSQTVPSEVGSTADLPTMRGVVIDSTEDDLLPLWLDDATFGRENVGIERIFATSDDQNHLDDYSLAVWVQERGVPGAINAFWSSSDPEVPAVTLEGLLAQVNGTTVKATDLAQPKHVFLNGNMALASDTVAELLGQ